MDATDRTTTTAAPLPGRAFITIVLLLLGVFGVVVGIWGLASPGGFAEWAGFPHSTHFLHDVGAFQIGIGVTLLLAAAWADAATVVLAGFLVGNTIHTANHVVDLDLGGHQRDAWALGMASVLALAALLVRVRQARRLAGRGHVRAE